MKFCNLIGCILTFPVWFGGNCMWNCTLSPCAFALNQLEKSMSRPIRLILVIIVICPILAIVGCLHWIFGIPKTVSAMGSFLDSDAESGFKNLVIPEGHNEIIGQANSCMDSVFKC